MQAEYASQISAIEKQLTELRAKQTKSIKEVLTLEQLTKLTDLNTAAKKKAAAKVSTAKPKPAPATEAPKTDVPQKRTTEKKPEAK